MEAYLSRGKKFIGDSVILQFEYDKKIIDYIKAFPIRNYDPDTKTWEIPLEQFPRFVDFYKKPINLHIRYGKSKEVKEIEIPADYIFNFTPYPHQLEGIKFGLNHDSFLLADQQGCGKTVQSASIACIRKKLYGYKHCLIICAVNGSKYNWKKECEQFTNEKAHILGSRITRNGNEVIKSSLEKLEDIKNIDTLPFFIITNKETLRNKDIIKELEKQSSKIDMCIYDEIHMSKNIYSQQGRGLLKVDCDCKIALSGTPILNNPIDTYMVMRWLGYETHSMTAYKQRYCVMGGYGGYEIISYKNIDELKNRFNHIQLRRLKEDCLNLPPKLYETEYLELSDKQRILYNEVKNDIIANIDNKDLSSNPLVRIIRLRQVTANPAILSDKITDSIKYDRCEELVEDLVKDNRKCLIFSNWVEVIKPLYERLQKYNPALIIGETKDYIEQEKSKLNNDPTCYCALGTIGAMGTSHTLTGADTVIFLDEPWNRGTKEQAEDRCHRIGTKNSVNIITFICKNTIDERINRIVQEKGEWADCIVDGKIIKRSDEILNFLLS